MELKEKVIALKKQVQRLLFNLAEVTAEGGIILLYEGEMAEGVAVFVYNAAGETIPAPEGTYQVPEIGTVIVEAGVVKSITKPEEPPVEQEFVQEPENPPADPDPSYVTDIQLSDTEKRLTAQILSQSEQTKKILETLADVVGVVHKFSQQPVGDPVERKRINATDLIADKAAKATKYFTK